MAAYRFAEHGGEVELELEADGVEGIFASALEAFAELVSTDGEGAAVERRIALHGDDRALLLVDWLSELVYLAEVDGFVPERTVAFELAGNHLRARVAGRRDQPLQLVKAVTLNNLELAQEGAVWHGRVVLDV